MPRPSARDDEHGVDPDVIAIAHVARSQPLGRGYDPAQTPWVQREVSGCIGVPGLHFDEGEGATSTRYDVDFSARHASPAGEDAPAVTPQVHGCEGFRASPTFLGSFAVHLRDSSSARA